MISSSTDPPILRCRASAAGPGSARVTTGARPQISVRTPGRASRRYHEDAVREIFEAAARARDADGAAIASRDGLTLAQLQEIGRDAGLAPERIAEAATALELRRGARPRGIQLGMPVSVGLTVPLPRAMDDHEWSLLVTELRQTFRARGQDRCGVGGLGFIGFALVLLLVLVLTAQPVDDLESILLLAGMGGAALGYNAVTLPPWARERERQMETAPPPPTDSG